MTLLNEADAVYVGDLEADRVYAGASLVWEKTGGAWLPTALAGLTVWLDASQLALADGAAVTSWPDLSGQHNDGAIVGTPLPVVRANALNGKAVVRTKINEGRVRGNTGIQLSGLPAPGYNYTIIYVSRMVTGGGRVFAGAYPEYTNFLVGYHQTNYDVAYDGAFRGSVVAIPSWPTPWRMYTYTASHDGTIYEWVFNVDGVLKDTGIGSGAGLHNRYHLSGYSQTGVEETCDSEVAEVLIYNRRLADAERIQAEGYLRTKWGL